jgi:hypothetical protein
MIFFSYPVVNMEYFTYRVFRKEMRVKAAESALYPKNTLKYTILSIALPCQICYDNRDFTGIFPR